MQRKKALNIIEGRMPRVSGDLIAMLKPAVALIAEPVPLHALRQGESRLGGAPHLPARFDWPSSGRGGLSFLAQVDLRTLPDRAEWPLPSDGWLVVFVDDKESAAQWTAAHVHVARVVAAPATLRATTPDGRMRRSKWIPCRLRLHTIWTLPSPDDPRYTLPLDIAAPTARLGYEDLRERLRGSAAGMCHQLFGYPTAPTGGIASSGMDLLLQLGTDPKGPGWRWADGRRLHVGIPAADWPARFDRALAALSHP